MFFIFIIFFTTVFANSYEKYIDLLPDEEKQEFLDHVARRVLENVESKEDKPKTKFSIELTDEQLKEHNDFVQTILQQESEQIKRRKGDSSMKKDQKSDEELKVKPLRDDTVIDKEEKLKDDALTEKEEKIKDDVVTEKEENQWDGTASEKEEILNSSLAGVRLTVDDTEIETSTVSTERSATQNVTIQKRSIQSDNSEEKTKASSEPSAKFNDLTKIEQVPTVSSLNPDENKATEATLPKGNFRRSLDASGESETTPNNIITTTETEIKTTTENIETQISNTTADSQEQNSQLDNSTNIGESESSKGVSFRVQESEEASTTQAKSSESSDEKTTNADTELTTVDSTLSSTLTDEGTTAAAIETTTVLFNADITETTPSDLNKETKSTTVASVDDIATTANINTENDITTIENVDTTASEITTVVPLAGITPAAPEMDLTKKPKKYKAKHNKIKKIENATVPSDIKKVRDIKNKLKKDEERKDFSLTQKDVYEKTLQEDKACGAVNGSCNHYRVYEIPENESPFLRSKDPMVDSPHFVPIYNYSPNNAYYNPHNRRGPNSGENHEEQNPLRGGQSANGISEFQLNFDGLMSKFGEYNKNNDTDKLTDIVKTMNSEEKAIVLESNSVEPYIRLKGGLKNQIRAIRDVLYQNKHLKNHNRLKKDTYSDVFKGVKNRDISMDYFYGRSKPNAEFDVINIPGKLDSKFLHTLFNGHDLLKVISLKKPSAKFRHRHVKTKNRNRNVKFADEIDNSFKGPKENLDYIRHKDEKSEIVAKNNDAKFNSYMNALKELIGQDNNALRQYDWLSTTVQIHAALSKLMELVSRVQNSEPVHPADLQILKYFTFLYNFATEIRKASHYGSKLRQNLILPRNRKRKNPSHVVKDMSVLNRVWLYLRSLMPDLSDRNGLAELMQVLYNVEDGLFDLHEAIRNIAKVTKFKNQNWYQNLKDLYLSTEEKQLREVLLHISFARLTDLVEFSCQNGVEQDYVEFMKTHKDIAKKTLEEFLFVLKITDEINNSV